MKSQLTLTDLLEPATKLYPKSRSGPGGLITHYSTCIRL
jgi:hypothetical protein